MNSFHTVETVLPTNNINLRSSYFYGGSGKMRSFFITRSSINDFKRIYKKYLNECSVYVLLDNIYPSKIYVGKATQLIKRLISHKYDNKTHNNETWWKIELAFVSDDAAKPLSEDANRYLENKMYTQAKAIVPKLTVNEDMPHLNRHIPNNVLGNFNNWFNELSYLMAINGYPIFNRLEYNSSTPHRTNNSKFSKLIFHYSYKYCDAYAQYCPNNNKMKVLRESTIRPYEAQNCFSKSNIKHLNDLINKNIIKNNTFTRDHTFSSPSMAGSIIEKGSSDGKRKWKRKGQELQQIFNI